MAVLFVQPPRARILVCTVSGIAKGASARWRTSIVAVVHGLLGFAAVKAGSPQPAIRLVG